MCGIVASRRRSGTLEFLLAALRRLEYRGYDSAGVALVTSSGAMHVERSSGRVAELERRCSAAAWPSPRTSDDVEIGIGHTRWATHGPATDANAHPHRDCTGRVAVVHNGIIENADELTRELAARGHALQSDVDSEVVAHLVEESLAQGRPLPQALLHARTQLRGSWALAVLDARSGCLALTVVRSPLLVGFGSAGVHVASDAGALAGWVDQVAVLEDGDLVEVGDELRWWDAAGSPTLPRALLPAQARAVELDLGQHADFMAKEIAEQPAMAARLVARLLPGLDGSLWEGLGLGEPRAIRFLACGSSLHASAAIARVASELLGLPTERVVASEADATGARDGALTVAVSQSGETADVLTALDRLSGPVLAITNNERSSLARRSDAYLLCDAGPEVSVAATKTFTAQVMTGTAAVLSLAARGPVPADYWPLVAAFAEIPGRLELAGALSGPVAEAVAQELTEAPGFLFLSRGTGMPYAQEGALKLKEITYRWAEALPAGELKHGTLALVSTGTPVVVVEAGDPARLAANVAEVRARGGRVLGVGAGPDAVFAVPSARHHLPWGPLEATIPLQHLARALAVALGRDADRPRNLAKSVTVE